MRSHSASYDNARSQSTKASVSTAPVFARRKWARRKTGDTRSLFDEGGRAADAASRTVPSERGGGSEAASLLFQYSGKNCSSCEVVTEEGNNSGSEYREEKFIGRVLKLRPCLCRKWFCPDCAPRLGKSLRSKLRERLKRFKRVFGITLTIDGSLFSSPEEAWRYVMAKRLICLLVKKLHARGYLNSKHYFWVVEWQQDTEQAHWHLLIDSEYVPFGEIVAIWSSFRPKSAPALPVRVTADNYKSLDRPAFGSVRFTLNGEVAWRAAMYATKYLVKVPDYGFPDWVLDFPGRVRRYDHSKGFFSDGKPKREPVQDDDGDISFDPEKLERRREFKTLRERMAQCKATTTIIRREVWRNSEGKLEERGGKFVGTLKLPYAIARLELGYTEDDGEEIGVGEWDLFRLRSMETGSNNEVFVLDAMEDW